MENATTTTEGTDELSKFRALIATQQQSPTGVNQPPPVAGDAVADPAAEMAKFRSLTAMPQSQSAVNRVADVEVGSALTMQEREGRRDPTGELIPISNEGIGSKYWRAAMQRGPDAQLAVLQKMYPGKKARILEDGKLTIELIDSQTGKPKDVIINPHGMDPADFADLVVQTPEIAASVAAGLMTGGTGFLRTMGQIAFSALAGAGTGAVRDVASRGAEGIPIEFGEIAQSRGTEAALDMFLSTAMMGVGKTPHVGSIFQNKIKAGTLEFDLQKGQQFVKQVFGEDFQLTPAQITGSSALGAVEAVESVQPGARTVMGRMRQKNDRIVQNMQLRSVGKLTPDEQIGEEAISTIRRVEVEPMENAIKAARTAAEQKGEQRVLDLIDNAIGVRRGARVSPSQAGAETLGAFETKLSEARSLVNDAYEQVRVVNGGVEVMLDGTAAAKAAQEIRKELPKITKGGDADVLKTGVPEGLLKSLDDLEKLDGATVSLQTLTNMKTAAHDAIAAFRTAHGDVKDRWFSKIAGAYETGIQEGIDNTGNPQLKAALTNARETYKKQLLPLERPGLKELAKDEFDAGRLSPEQVATRLFEGPKAIENFRLLKETLGANNPAFKTLKRSWADSQIAEVSDPVTGSIDAKALVNRFSKLQADRPELMNEMFSQSDFSRLIIELNSLSKFKGLKTLDQESVEVLMSTPGVNSADFKAVVDMQVRRDKAYANKLIGDVADGLPIASKLKPTEFVQRISNTSTPTKDVEKILDTLAKENPEAREAIATATLYDLFQKASITEPATATGVIRGGAPNISGTKLAEAYGRPGTPERIRNDLLLGRGEAPINPGGPNPTRQEIIDAIVGLKVPGEVRDKTFSGSGGIGATMQTAKVLSDPIKYASNYVKKMFFATLWTTELGTKLVSNRVLSPAESAAVANTLIASEPFARRILEVTGDETTAGAIVGELKDSIDQVMSELTDSPEARDRRELEKLISGQPAKVTTPR
jgi:hypothetical protein